MLATYEKLYMIDEFEYLKLLDETTIATGSQLKQDLFVLLLKKFKQEGYFVEFGACDGVHFSNSLLLEKEYKWTGILAEPCKKFQEDLYKNRNCLIDTRVVYSSSANTIEFTDVINRLDLSGIAEDFIIEGKINKKRGKSQQEKYNVQTISLTDLLNEHNAPRNIDYLSIDTEGSEFLILNSFDFDQYEIDIITVEHNYNEETRQNIKNLLEKNNYIRVLESLSKWDDWYVSKNFLNKDGVCQKF